MCRDLKASEIDVRVQSQKQSGVILLLYKNARVDMDILDEEYGKFGWQRKHEFKDGRLYCTVSVWDKEKAQWISREDVGTESNTETEKGQASDSFKRACVNFGSGRELYTSPSIWVNASDYNIDEKGKCKDAFSVSNIIIENKVIVGLEIKNDKTNKVVFTFGKCKGNKKASNSSDNKTDKQIPTKEENEPKITSVEPQKEITMTYEEALNHKVEVTSLAGMTLKEVYKTDRASIKVIYEQGCTKTKKAIDIIQAEIKKAKENKQ